MIEFDALAMKADTDELYVIFLLKKNMRQDIIKMILGYLLIKIKAQVSLVYIRLESRNTNC